MTTACQQCWSIASRDIQFSRLVRFIHHGTIWNLPLKSTASMHISQDVPDVPSGTQPHGWKFPAKFTTKPASWMFFLARWIGHLAMSFRSHVGVMLEPCWSHGSPIKACGFRKSRTASASIASDRSWSRYGPGMALRLGTSGPKCGNSIYIYYINHIFIYNYSWGNPRPKYRYNCESSSHVWLPEGTLLPERISTTSKSTIHKDFGLMQHSYHKRQRVSCWRLQVSGWIQGGSCEATIKLATLKHWQICSKIDPKKCP